MGPQEMLDRAEVKNKWQLTPLKDFKSPRLTERMWRTAVVVLLTSLIYEYLIPGGRNPCFALIGAVYGVGSRFEEGFHNGINRLIGTFVGGILVIPFYMLYQKYGCNMQFGGDDQWSNMLGGTELIRRKLGKDAHAMTITLLLNSEGNKMGKTAKGAVWLDPEKTSPFDFYQYWRNVSDDDVLKCLRMLTFLPLEQIDEMDKWEGSQLNQAKEILAFELTKMVHGEEEAAKAQEGARALFSSGNAAQMPEVELTDADFEDGQIGILNLLVKAGLAPSNGEARRNVQQGGVSIDGNKVEDVRAQISKDSIGEDGIVLKRGKKKFMKIVVR